MQKRRTTIDLDFQGFAAAMDRKPLAQLAEGVSKLSAHYGCAVAAQRLGKQEGWVSKMRKVANAVLKKSIAGTLVLEGKVADLELAYYVALIESKSERQARAVSRNIASHTRHTVKQIWEGVR